MNKKLNIIFDKYDDDGFEVWESINSQDFIRVIDFFREIEYKNIQTYKIEDIDKYPKEKFYYLITYNMLYDYKNLNNKNVNSILKAVYNINNLYLIFFNYNESESLYNIVDFFKLIKKHNIDHEKIYLCNNNYKLNELNNFFNFNFKTHITKTLSLLVKKSDKNNNKTPKYNKIKKNSHLFLCQNNDARQHRVLILALIKKYNILNDVDWSMIVNPSNDRFDIEELYNIIEQKKIIYPEIDYFYHIELKTCTHEKNILLNKSHMNWENNIILDTYENTYFNIITETYFFDYDIVHITEKSFKPFNYFQFPLFLATHHHVKHFRKNYDFDIFDDIIDHSYDNIVDNTDRLFKFTEELKRIQENKDFFIDFYKKNEHRFLENNKKYLKINNNDDINFFNDLI